MAEPGYLKLHDRGILRERIDRAVELLYDCRLCPRRCGADRLHDGEGFCKSGRLARVASASPHFGEEAPLVGKNGSGTIFISSCNLLCTFCQNYDISHYAEGTEVSSSQLAGLMVNLAGKGCHNINFVTPSHVVPQIFEALPEAIDRGLTVPLVFNSGGYDSADTLRILVGIVDIYMPDFKFWDGKWSGIFCTAPDYSEIARKALVEMHRQVGDLLIAPSGVARRGLLLRHLVMPNGIAGTEDIMRFVAEEISPSTYVNLMDQYRPCFTASSAPKINRRIMGTEYEDALKAARRAGLSRLDRRNRGIFRY